MRVGGDWRSEREGDSGDSEKAVYLVGSFHPANFDLSARLRLPPPANQLLIPAIRSEIRHPPLAKPLFAQRAVLLLNELSRSDADSPSCLFESPVEGINLPVINLEKIIVGESDALARCGLMIDGTADLPLVIITPEKANATFAAALNAFYEAQDEEDA